MREKALYDLIDRIECSDFSYFEWKERDQTLILSKTSPENFKRKLSDQVGENKRTLSDRKESIPTDDAIQAEVEPQVSINQEKIEEIKSPIVGVVYLQPSSSDSVFVSLGDRIEVGQTLCIVEAMKMMNEIKSSVSGILKSIRVENEEVVEFDQVLFEVIVE